MGVGVPESFNIKNVGTSERTASIAQLSDTTTKVTLRILRGMASEDPEKLV